MFEDLIIHFGSLANMARALGVTRVAVSLWGVDGIPPQRAIQIERVTGGKFKAVDIEGAKKDGEG